MMRAFTTSCLPRELPAGVACTDADRQLINGYLERLAEPEAQGSAVQDSAVLEGVDKLCDELYLKLDYVHAICFCMGPLNALFPKGLNMMQRQFDQLYQLFQAVVELESSGELPEKNFDGPIKTLGFNTYQDIYRFSAAAFYAKYLLSGNSVENEAYTVSGFTCLQKLDIKFESNVSYLDLAALIELEKIYLAFLKTPELVPMIANCFTELSEGCRRLIAEKSAVQLVVPGGKVKSD